VKETEFEPLTCSSTATLGEKPRQITTQNKNFSFLIDGICIMILMAMKHLYY